MSGALSLLQKAAQGLRNKAPHAAKEATEQSIFPGDEELVQQGRDFSTRLRTKDDASKQLGRDAGSKDPIRKKDAQRRLREPGHKHSLEPVRW